IASWNCRGLRSKLQEIHTLDYALDIWCLGIAIKKSLKFEILNLFQFSHKTLEILGVFILTTPHVLSSMCIP
ncbi:hypothetical protein ALC53_10917, partial [Atta colombica]